MSTGVQANTHILAFDHESTAFATAEADFDSEKIKIGAWDVSVELKRGQKENQAIKGNIVGAHPTTPGPKSEESEVGFSTYAEGLGTAAGDSTLAVKTGLTHLMGAELGGVPTFNTGSTVNGTPTPAVDAVTENDVDNHVVNEFAGFVTTSGVEVRPIIAYSSGAMTPAIELTAAPAADSVVYGCATIKSDNSANFYIQGEAVGRLDAESWDFFGCAGSFSISEQSANEPPTISHSLKVASYNADVSGLAATQAAPVVDPPIVAAGGEYYIAPYHASAAQTGTELRFHNIGVELGREYTPDPDGNDANNCCGWVPTSQDTTITIHVAPNQALPSGLSSSNWRDVWGHTTDNDFQLLFNFGARTAGRIFSFYARRCHIVMEPELVDLDGIAALKLTLKPRAGAGENQIWVGLT